ncbi:DUF3953 domain-containing protein [Halalkalibacter akibai]|uniref:DUF3953 domain-containing protein n=1 Tax=Halalkalibacter akibai TaxID=1411 RepID=UPI0034E2ECB4
MVQSVTANFSLQFYVLLSFGAMLLVIGISEFRKDRDSFLPYWFFICSGITLLIAILVYFNRL